MSHVLRTIHVFVHRADRRTDGGAGKDAGEDFDHHRQGVALVPGHRQHGSGQGGSRIRRGLSLWIQGPACGDRLALLIGGDDVAAGHDRGGEVDLDRIALAGRKGSGDRIRAKKSLAGAFGRHGRLSIGRREKNEILLRHEVAVIGAASPKCWELRIVAEAIPWVRARGTRRSSDFRVCTWPRPLPASRARIPPRSRSTFSSAFGSITPAWMRRR